MRTSYARWPQAVCMWQNVCFSIIHNLFHIRYSALSFSITSHLHRNYHTNGKGVGQRGTRKTKAAGYVQRRQHLYLCTTDNQSGYGIRKDETLAFQAK